MMRLLQLFKLCALCFVLLSPAITKGVFATITVSQKSAVPISSIVTLAPHLTEWVYALKLEDKLVGVSAYSDYPAAANEKSIIADANGIDFKSLISLNPDLILVWEGGNKSQDIGRLESLGFELFRSSPNQLDDIGTELYQLGKRLNAIVQAKLIQQRFNAELTALRQQYQSSTAKSVFFYLWTKPIMTIGINAWANQVLATCNAQTIFADSPSDYPEVRLAEVLIRQPSVLVTTLTSSINELEAFWAPHRDIINAPIVKVDGTIINRFTPRITEQIGILCASLHQQ